MKLTPTASTQYVCLIRNQDCDCGCNMPGYRNRFFTSWRIGDGDPTKLRNGETAYDVISYADSIPEAQHVLWLRD